jgi:hypothetical protein
MVVTPPTIAGWVVDSDTSNHTTQDVGNWTIVLPFNSTTHSSIVVGNGSILQVTSVGDTVFSDPFYLTR